VFTADIAQAAAWDAVVHPLTMPAFTGHPIDGQVDFFAEAAAIIDAKASSPRDSGMPVFAFGRNLGGSLLGHAIKRGTVLDGVVFIGVIPSLTDFRIHGDHPSARRYRAALDGDTSRVGTLEPFDLTASLRAIDPQSCLHQVGQDDPYLDARSFKIFAGLEAKFRVKYHDDNHAMEAPATLARRWEFIAGLADKAD